MLWWKSFSILGIVLSSCIVCNAQPGPEYSVLPRSTAQQDALPEPVITFERREDFFGTGPAYKLAIYADGEVVFEGEKNVEKKGAARGSISQEALRRLIEEFEKINFFSLRDEYMEPMGGKERGCPNSISDGGYVHLSIGISGRRKGVLHYQGCREGLEELSNIGHPQELFKLEELIEKVVNSQQWIK